MNRPILSTLDVNRDSKWDECPPRHKHPGPVRRYACPICEHYFTIVGGMVTEDCPGCDCACTGKIIEE